MIITVSEERCDEMIVFSELYIMVFYKFLTVHLLQIEPSLNVYCLGKLMSCSDILEKPWHTTSEQRCYNVFLLFWRHLQRPYNVYLNVVCQL